MPPRTSRAAKRRISTVRPCVVSPFRCGSDPGAEYWFFPDGTEAVHFEFIDIYSRFAVPQADSKQMVYFGRRYLNRQLPQYGVHTTFKSFYEVLPVLSRREFSKDDLNKLFGSCGCPSVSRRRFFQRDFIGHDFTRGASGRLCEYGPDKSFLEEGIHGLIVLGCQGLTR